MSTPWIRIFAMSSFAAFCFLCPNPNVRQAGAAPPPGYVLDWAEEFTSPTLDPNRWTKDNFPKGGNFQVPQAVQVSGGRLIITTYTSGGKHYSGGIRTQDKYTPLYGYYEASIDFDASPGMFSTWWLWSNNMPTRPYNDPHGKGTEMDIAEHSVVIRRGPGDYVPTRTQASSTLHWDGYATDTTRVAGGDLYSGASDLSVGFHTYGVEWAPDAERFYYDGNLVWTVIDSPGDPPSPTNCAFPPCAPKQWQRPYPQSPSVFAPVSHTNQFLYLSSEVGAVPCWCGPIPTQGYGPLVPEGTAPVGAPLFAPQLVPSVTKMYVEYVRRYRETQPPTYVADLCVGSTTNSTITLTWTAPGDNYGTCAEYDLRRSTSPISDFNFNQATRVNVPPPHSPWSAESFEVISLLTCQTHYFALKTRDISGNWSGISNVLSAMTGCASVSPGGRAAQTPIPCNPAAASPVVLDEGSPSFSAPSPNPASGTTSFLISVPAGFQGAKLRVDVFDVAGRRVRSLVDRIASQGTAPVEWNLLNDSGRRVASGLYRVRVDVGDRRMTFPLLVLR